MFYFLNHDTNYNFMGARKIAFTLSVLLIVGSLAAVMLRGLNFGIEFTGGVVLRVQYPQAAELESVRGTLDDEGFGDALVQSFGTASDVMIRLPPVEDAEALTELSDRIVAALQEEEPGVTLSSRAVVDSQVGDDLTEQGGLALLFALIFIFGYIMLRFQWKFAAGAIAALAHDVILTVGFFALVPISFDLSVLAALLAVIGYSLNDTIVVYDRIRENFKEMRRGSAAEIINTSVNQMLARTMITGVTTLIVLAALALIGGPAVFGFSIALIVGIVVGTYSSIYVASALALKLDVSPTDLIPPQREEIDHLP